MQVPNKNLVGQQTWPLSAILEFSCYRISLETIGRICMKLGLPQCLGVRAPKIIWLFDSWLGLSEKAYLMIKNGCSVNTDAMQPFGFCLCVLYKMQVLKVHILVLLTVLVGLVSYFPSIDIKVTGFQLPVAVIQVLAIIKLNYFRTVAVCFFFVFFYVYNW